MELEDVVAVPEGPFSAGVVVLEIVEKCLSEEILLRSVSVEQLA